MQVFITGATGFIGRALVSRLLADGHSIAVWVRDARKARALLGPEVELVESSRGDLVLDQAVDRADAMVNLAGAPILPGRWTAARKRELVSSRVDTTNRLVDALTHASPRPRVFISASAVGFYGDTGDVPVDEEGPPGAGFLADLCAAWEGEAQRAQTPQTRVVIGRIGVVLGPGGGMLASLLPQFRLGLGGSLGSGRQYIPWIHLEDLVGVIARALVDDRFQGVLNVVGPAPIRLREFTRLLGRLLKRPSFFRVPGNLLRVFLGEAASTLLNSSHVRPRRLELLGFVYRFPEIEAALRDVLGKSSSGKKS